MFDTRRNAGRRLASAMAGRGLDDPVVVGIPRGGVAVAAEVAAGFGVAATAVVVRKLPCPWYPRLGMGAVAEGGVRLLNREVIDRYGVEPQDLAYVTQAERARVGAAIETYRDGAPRVAVAGRDVILVDDGMVTGFTAMAALANLRAAGASSVVVAAPVASSEAIKRLLDEADELVVLCAVDWLDNVDAAYLGSDDLGDAALRRLLRRRSLRPLPQG